MASYQECPDVLSLPSYVAKKKIFIGSPLNTGRRRRRRKKNVEAQNQFSFAASWRRKKREAKDSYRRHSCSRPCSKAVYDEEEGMSFCECYFERPDGQCKFAN